MTESTHLFLRPDDLKACMKAGDGRVLSRRVQDAIEAVAAAGGGCVELGSGDWLCATIFMRSCVELRLSRGCRIVADADISHYTPSDHPWFENHNPGKSLLVAQNCDQIALTGAGVIDGSCMRFWVPCEDEAERPHGIFRFKPRRDGVHGPATVVEIAHCHDVVVDGFTIINSPGWTLHVYNSDHVSVRNVKIRNNRLIPYTDGIGINASRDVRVTHCDVDTGDDAIIIKATHPDLACERVTVTNCVASSNCSAFGLGADAAGTIRDVVFSDCVADRSLRMIQVEQWYAGTIERAIFSNITGRTFPDDGIHCERPIYVDIQQWKRRPDKKSPDSPPPLGVVRDLVFHSILCETRGRIILTAQNGGKIENVTLDTISLRVPEIEDPEITVPPARSMQLSNFNPETRAARAALVADNVDGLYVRDVRVIWPEKPTVSMAATCLRQCENVRMDSPDLNSCQRADFKEKN